MKPHPYAMAAALKAYALWMLLACCSLSSCTLQPPTSDDQLGENTILKAKYARPLKDIRFEPTAERLARGKYLVEGPLHCFQCHAGTYVVKPGEDPVVNDLGAGRRVIDRDTIQLYAPNITSDKETGIGNFTDDMIARAIREGVGYDGRALHQRMPWYSYRHLSDEDLASVICHLRTLPAIRNKIPKRKLPPSIESRLTTRPHPLEVAIPQPNLDDKLMRGKYLISVAACRGCHTRLNNRKPGAYGGGAQMEAEVFTPNISSHSTGVGAWPVETFKYTMRNGKGKSGSLNGIMPWPFFRNMSDEDLEAIYLALMDTYPVNHLVLKGAPPTHCEVCNKEHGMGNQNKIEHPATYNKNIDNLGELAGKYINTISAWDTINIKYDSGRLKIGNLALNPINESQYFAEGTDAPVSFVRGEDGNISGLEVYDLGMYLYERLK